MIKTNNYKIYNSNNRLWLESPGGNCSSVVFYYDRDLTKKYHKNNIKEQWTFKRQLIGDYKQLIGLDYELTNKRVYTRLINAYIKNEI